MAHKNWNRAARAAFVAIVFGLGFLAGSATRRPADAQLGDVAGEVMKKAGESSGSVGSAAQLGTAIVDMQQHVSALQKNLDTLNKIKAALGG